jgi:hypothetical protein
MEAEVIAEPGEFGPEEKSSEENAFPESGEHKPASGPIEQSSTRDDAQVNAFEASPVQAPQHTDFEPREYLPPSQQEHPAPTSQQERASRVLNTAERKETIARLESWLTIIKKEK